MIDLLRETSQKFPMGHLYGSIINASNCNKSNPFSDWPIQFTELYNVAIGFLSFHYFYWLKYFKVEDKSAESMIEIRFFILQSNW